MQLTVSSQSMRILDKYKVRTLIPYTKTHPFSRDVNDLDIK